MDDEKIEKLMIDERDHETPDLFCFEIEASTADVGLLNHKKKNEEIMKINVSLHVCNSFF